MKKRIRSLLFMVFLLIGLMIPYTVKGEESNSEDMDLITGIQDIYYEIGSGKIDYGYKVEVKSGYNYNIIDHGLNLERVNTEGYTVSYYVTKDNVTGISYPIKVYVFEELPDPVLKLTVDDPTEGITFYALEDLTEKDLLKFVEATGLHGKDLTSVVTIEGFEQLQSKKVGTYDLIFRVEEKVRTHNATRTLMSELKVQVHLVDHVNPIIHLLKDRIIVDIYDSDVSYESFFEIYDAYDQYHENSLVVEYDDSLIDYNKIGTYELYVKVKDSNGNINEEKFNVEVVDKTPPEIKVIQSVVVHHISDDKKPDYSKMVETSDNYDKDITDILVLDDNVNYKRKGAYPVTIVAYDESLNSSSVVVVVRVVDDEIPVFDVVTDQDGTITIPKYKTNKLWYDFMAHFVSTDAQYRYGAHTDRVNFDKPGQYKVEFYADDLNGNRISKIVDVIVEDDVTPPVIYGYPEKFSIPVHTKEYDFLDGVAIVDDNWDDPELKLKTNVNFDIISKDFDGEYYVTYIGRDNSGNEIEVRVPVIVVDDQAPKVTLKKESIQIEVEDHSYDYREVLEVRDNYDSRDRINVVCDDGEVNYGTVGKYRVTCQIKDSSNNEETIEMMVMIEDTKPAFVEVSGPIFVEVGSKPGFWDYLSIQDNYDSLEDLQVDYIDEEVNYDRLGNYVALIRVTDRSGNVSEKQVVIRVIDTQAPVFEGVKDRSIRSGQKINLLKGVVVRDNYDGDITSRIEVSGQYNTKQKGKYLITLTVSDSSGNETTETFILTVKPNFLPVILILLFVCLGLTGFGMVLYRVNQYDMKLTEAIETEDWTLGRLDDPEDYDDWNHQFDVTDEEIYEDEMQYGNKNEQIEEENDGEVEQSDETDEEIGFIDDWYLE